VPHCHLIVQVLALILSDVIGDPLEIIASGPTVRPAAAQSNSAEIVQEFGLADKLDPAVLQLLLADPEEKIDEDFSHVSNLLLGNISLALQAVIQQAAEVR
jgi:glycerate 2-kinase